MSDNYRDRLFLSYHDSHIVHLGIDDPKKLTWFSRYVKFNYLKYIDSFDRDAASLLEIGCNRGYLLAALSHFGFKRLAGIDLSPSDLDAAKKIAPTAELTCENAFDFLANKSQCFDVVILKAVLEHFPKDEIIPFLTLIQKALKKNGIAIIDIPNMDWLFASHERYMDFTHEIGFTKESLSQIIRNVFSDVEVIPVDVVMPAFLGRLKCILSRFILGKLLSWADPEGASNPIWARSIIAVAKK